MKNVTHSIIMGILTLFSIYLYLLAEAPLQRVIFKEEPLINTKIEEVKALEYLNYLRVKSGLIPLSENRYLKEAAKNHANYLILNRTIGHFEDRNRSGFTGKFGSNRAMFVGYKTSMVIENISNNNFNHRESIDGLMSAIYHRFGFLDFNIDEIGISIVQDLTDRSNTAFVYDMGSVNLENLCKGGSSRSFETYVIGICRERSLKIDGKRFTKTLNINRSKNSAIVVYPFDGQENIPPAFYDELPDPLPEYSVSGFPISISFNGFYFKRVKVLDFRLFKGKEEIKDKVVYSRESDPNRRLKNGEFALFPLKRLDWDSRYRVEVKYLADGEIYTKSWSFKTKSFKSRFHQVTGKDGKFTITEGVPSIFYFPPTSKRDIFGDLRYPSFLDIDFIDKNTIKVTANSGSRDSISLKLGNKILNLEIKKIN